MSLEWTFLLSVVACIHFVQGQDCAGTVVLNATMELQYLMTPGYETDGKYPRFLDCNFIIKAPDKTRIQIEIVEFDMEQRIFTECVDYVAIYNGSLNLNDSLIGQYCGTVEKRELLTTVNSAFIQFRSDDLYESKGAKIAYRYFDNSSCPPGWIELNDTRLACVSVNLKDKVDYITAQQRCLEAQSNLLTLTETRYEALYHEIGNMSNNIWTAYQDAASESRFQAGGTTNDLDSDFDSKILSNTDEHDCMTVNYGRENNFDVQSCANVNYYACEMEKGKMTKLTPVSVTILREGTYTKSSQFSLWLLLFLIGLLFLTILLFLCFMCWKQKSSSRVHTETTQQTQPNAFLNNVPQSHPVPPTPVAVISNNNVTSNPSTGRVSSAKVSPTPQAVEISKPPRRFPVSTGPNKVIMSEEPSETDKHVETVIMGASHLDAQQETHSPLSPPQPQPRSLPPREGTFQSLMTRDGSTMRTRHHRDLFDRPKMHVLDNVSAISLDEFWSNKR